MPFSARVTPEVKITYARSEGEADRWTNSALVGLSYLSDVLRLEGIANILKSDRFIPIISRSSGCDYSLEETIERCFELSPRSRYQY
jgi:hypothetical protein